LRGPLVSDVDDGFSQGRFDLDKMLALQLSAPASLRALPVV
jgi:hypothetical protein